MRTNNYVKTPTKIRYNIIVVGAGGTGGNLLKELGRFLKFYNKEYADWRLTVIDGDLVEEKNEARQPFQDFDVMQNKAAVFKEQLEECFGLPADNITAHADYISTKEELLAISEIEETPSNRQELVILVGAVDNHRARQVMHEFFYEKPNVIYIDSANEFTNGEVVCGLRLADMNIAPPRGYYYPDVLTDRSPSAKELSCGAVNVSAPQHMVTNLCAANHCLSFVAQAMQEGRVEGGILYFDAFKHYSRFDVWENRDAVPTKEEVLGE